VSEFADRKLLRIIKIAPVLLTIVFAIIVFTVVFQQNRDMSQTMIDSMRTELFEDRKLSVSEQVNQATQQIEYEKSLTIETLKTSIRERIDEAHGVAMSIYEANKDLGEERVTNLIKQALRPIRFNENRGYFFIYEMTGDNVMHPLLPDIEGTSAWNFQDTKGDYIVRDMARLVREAPDHGAFHTWWFRKPGFADQEFEKIGYGKLFEPYDWFIGTGEYVVDVESMIQRDVLNWVSELRFDDHGYIFIVDEEGKIIAHKDKQLIGQISTQFFPAYQQAEQKTGFIEYTSMYQPENLDESEKVSYVRYFPDWKWAIGSGIYFSEVIPFIDEQVQYQSQQNLEYQYKLLFICTIMSLVFGASSVILTRYISTRFSVYEDKINNSFESLERSREQLKELAALDALTQLPNRLELENKIKSNIEICKKSGQKMAVMFVDLDDFKKINDQHGHSIGDELLKVISREFESVIESHETVARFGGDEFIFLFPHLSDKQQAYEKAAKIEQSLRQQFLLNSILVNTSCSIGVSFYPDDGYRPVELISKADIVLYRTKLENKGSVMFYDHHINDEVQYRYLIEDELRQAIKNETIDVHYQPQICATTGEILGLEALCRWEHDRLGSIRPDQFIHIAEETGLIFELGDIVFAKACRDVKVFSEKFGRDLGISINISPIQLLKYDFVQNITAIADNCKLKYDLITLELTENVLIAEMDKIKPILTSAKALGFQISLDDFGTGYSSLSYLNQLPIDEIKIDRTFIHNLTQSQQSKSLVKTIVAIATSNDTTVVAEGVEDAMQVEQLQALGCHELQGFYYSKALPLDELVLKYCAAQSKNAEG
jgi:diguanylate cyclase (GGDEF)-like protein